MNLYGQDLSIMDFAHSDYPHIINSLSYPSNSLEEDEEVDYALNSITVSNNSNNNNNQSPPNYRHDGMSPLPLGMDWSPPPLKWNGKDSIWPRDHNSTTGWSYCVTIPSWVISTNSKASDSVVFYRVQIGIQSPEGITTTREILRRFSDFLELLSDLKKAFPKKNLPPPPPKKIMSMTSSSTALEERRCSLEGWMERLLSDIDLSRSAAVAIFLELEAAARSSFLEIDEQTDTNSDVNVAPDNLLQSNSDVVAEPPATALDHGNDSTCQISEIATISDDKSCIMNSSSGRKLTVQHEDVVGHETTRTRFFEEKNKIYLKGDNKFMDNICVPDDKLDGHIKELSPGTTTSDVQGHLQTLLTTDEQQKLNRLLVTAQNKLITAKSDMEDIIARLNQETAVKQYLSTKVDSTAVTYSQVKDLNMEVLETTRQSCMENMEHANLVERERFTHMQLNIEELQKKCLEQEIQLKSVQKEKMHAESERSSTSQKNVLLPELDAARDQIQQLQKQYQEEKVKSKADMKLLAKEVKSLRSSQLQLKQELSELVKEKVEIERVIEDERQNVETANAANAKLLHECDILRARLQECSVDFLSGNKDKLTLDTLVSDAIDLLKTSDDRIGLILAEAQLLVQDMENATTADNVNTFCKKTDSELRKMLTHVFIDNARLRKEINAIFCYALEANMGTENTDDAEEISLKRTVLSKFLER